MKLSRLFVLFALVCCQNEGGGEDEGPDTVDAGTDAGADPCADRQEHSSCTDQDIPGSCEVDFDCVLKCRAGFAECTTIGDRCGCERTCYFTGLGNFCEREGDKAEGERCDSSPDCAAPGQCLQEHEADWPKCFLACDDSRPCAKGTCTGTDFGFSVCVEEAESDGGMDGGD